MTVKTQINEVLAKKMDRQEFIKSVAVGLVAVSSAGAALRFLAQKQQSQPTSKSSSGYGSSAYGG